MTRILWLADAARATGYPVVETAGWRTRGSDRFDPRGVVWHHTAGRSTGDMPTLDLLIRGRADLPGPLAHFGLGRSGTIYVVASGKANHAGYGGWNGYSGNASVLGIEAEHTGQRSDPWPAVQLDAYRKLTAELLTRLGTSVEDMCGHKEWAPTRKVDPVGLDMNEQRRLVAQLMEDTMTPAQEAKLDEALALLRGLPKATWAAIPGGKDTAWQVLIRIYAAVADPDLLDDDDLQRIAARVNDELDRRARQRLGPN